MKKIIAQIKENKWIHYILLIIIGIILSIPICKIQIRDTHDGFLHLLRLFGTNECISIGQIPPIVIPNFCNGSGYAMNLFYPQLVTYLPLIIKIFTPSYSTALKIFGAICIIASGITMYNFVYQVTKKRSIAFFSSIIYLILPYKLANIYRRYAIGEFAAFVFVPILFQGMYNLFNEDGKKHYYIAIGTIGLILTHTITTLYCAIFCVIYIIFFLTKLKDKEVIKKILVNLFFILLICMVFYVPVLEAINSAQYTIFNDSIMRTTSEYTSKNTLELSQFFVDQEENGVTFIIGIPIVTLIIFTLFTIKKVDKNYKAIYIVFLLFAFLSIAMTTKYFPWKYMPDFLCKLQYPWRMVGFFGFFISLICGVNLHIVLNKLVKNDIVKIIVVFILICASIICTINILSQYYTKDNTRDYKYEELISNNPKINHMHVNRDYLPVKAIYGQKTYMMNKQEKTDVLEGYADIVSEEKQGLYTLVQAKNIERNTILEFSYIYYPGYEIIANIDGQSVKLNPIESDNGYLATIIENKSENISLEVNYKGTFITKISYIISIASTILFIMYIIFDKKGKINL